MIELRLLAAALALVILAPAGAPAQTAMTIFGNGVPGTPVVTDDTSAVTLGVKFFSTVAGTVSAVRFYRGARNGNGYSARLYASNGTMLAQATLPGDPRSFTPGWKTATFAAPVSISANTVYIASYYTSNGRYPDDEYGLTNGKNSAPLMAVASTPGAGNGVYTYSTGFPNQTWHDSNYWVDVNFTSTAPSLLLSFTPPNPSIPASSPGGTVVAGITATWSNGSPFTGTLGFTTPYSNDGSTFAISGNDVIVNPSGPGLSGDPNTIQNVSIQAVQ